MTAAGPLPSSSWGSPRASWGPAALPPWVMDAPPAGPPGFQLQVPMGLTDGWSSPHWALQAGDGRPAPLLGLQPSIWGEQGGADCIGSAPRSPAAPRRATSTFFPTGSMLSQIPVPRSLEGVPGKRPHWPRFCLEVQPVARRATPPAPRCEGVHPGLRVSRGSPRPRSPSRHLQPALRARGYFCPICFHFAVVIHLKKKNASRKQKEDPASTAWCSDGT